MLPGLATVPPARGRVARPDVRLLIPIAAFRGQGRLSQLSAHKRTHAVQQSTMSLPKPAGNQRFAMGSLWIKKIVKGAMKYLPEFHS
jgi:hypothetical protein